MARMLDCVRFLPIAALASFVPCQDVEALVAEGIAKAKDKAFAAALKPLHAAVAKDAGHVEARRWRAHCFTGLEKYDLALDDLNQVIKVDPSKAWTWYARGMAKHHLGRNKEAIGDYSQALRRDPMHAKAMQWRGFNYDQIGDHLGAYLDYSTALKRDHENAWLYHARGRAAVAMNQLDRAAQDFRAAILLDSKRPESHAQLGFLLAAQGKTKEALAALDAAHALDPRNQEYVNIWRYWIRATTRGVSAAVSDSLPRLKWPGEITKVLLGTRTRSQVLLRLSAYGFQGKERRHRQCEAEFYLGIRALIESRGNRAREHFKRALILGDAEVPEWRAAHYLARRR